MSTVDPQCQARLAALADSGLLPLGRTDVARARSQYIALSRMLATDFVAPLVMVEEIEIPGYVGALAGRIHRPAHTPEQSMTPVVLYLHGGGHVLGNLETHDMHARMLCADTGCVVISVDYRKAPEAMWPAAANDAVAAMAWVLRNRSTFSDSPLVPVGVAGDSAGGNLAAVVLNHHAQLPGPIAAGLLIYPALDFSARRQYESRGQWGEDGYLTLADMAWFGLTYAGKGAPVDDPDLSPIRGDLTGNPTTLVVTAEVDPLRDEAVAYVEKAIGAGVAAEHIDAVAMPHGFYDFAVVSEQARAAILKVHQRFADHMRR